MKRLLTVWLLVVFSSAAFSQEKDELVYNSIGIKSAPTTGEVQMELVGRLQHRVSATRDANDHFDRDINSPKSVNYLPSKKKFYVQSLEGFETVAYDIESLDKLKVIRHTFTPENQHLFKDGESKVFDYEFRFRKSDFNIFSGKPVESCFSHNGKYLWVTYYRRSYDQNSQSPSAVAIIDTDKDEIVRVMPTGILPKMIAASPDNKYVAVTHWGDNTLGIIDISSDDPFEFEYLHHLVVDKRLQLNFAAGEDVDRDSNCGYCLRGTVFTPDSKYLLVGRMGGGGIAVFDVDKGFDYSGVTLTNHHNIRHLVISGNDLVISTNVNGYVDKVDWRDFIESRMVNPGNTNTISSGLESCYVGPGVRTISVTSNSKYIFACVNNLSKIVVVESATMKKVAEIPADSYPVGMELSEDDQYLLVTSQGKYRKGGGHSVMIYKITYTQS
ncbi:MAG: YncE family protein [Cyclobacteriaceae bacterium]